MKIKTKGKVYIQKYDAEFILKAAKDVDFKVPKYVVDEILSSENECIMQTAGSNNEFIVLKDPKSRFWIMDQFFILDYDSYKNMTADELRHLAEAKEDEENRRYATYEEVIDSDKSRSFYDSFTIKNVLIWQSEVPSINILYNIKRLGLTLNFPEDYEGDK
jgi:hypothetical protein